MKLAKLLTIQSRLNVPKGQVNQYGNYKYRSCEDILEALKPILAEVEAVIVLTDEMVLIGDRHYVKAFVALCDVSGDIIAQTSAFAREPLVKKGMDESQITGAASSYARKYALNALFAIDDTKDADSTNKHEAFKEVKVSGEEAAAGVSRKFIDEGGFLYRIKEGKKEFCGKLTPEQIKKMTGGDNA